MVAFYRLTSFATLKEITNQDLKRYLVFLSKASYMKMKFLCLSVALLLPLLMRAQGVITVFSEDGDKFYLVLNGIRQNQVAQTNVRVDGLTNDYYNGKIIFEDGTKPEISKNMNTKDAATGQFAEVTFKIKKTKDGELKLRYFGVTPVPVNYNPPPDMYQVHYGQQAPPPPPAASQPVQQTTVTTTTTTTSAPNGLNMNVGAGGVNISMNIADPNAGGNGNVNINMQTPDMQQTSVRQTSTTTSYSNSSSTSNNMPATYQSGAPTATSAAGANCGFPMSPGNFGSAKSSISASSFDDTKLSTAKSILVSNCMSADQVAQICGLFSFEESKLAFAKYAYGRTTDPSNYFKVLNVFTFESSKTDLNNYIANGGR